MNGRQTPSAAQIIPSAASIGASGLMEVRLRVRVSGQDQGQGQGYLALALARALA